MLWPEYRKDPIFCRHRHESLVVSWLLKLRCWLSMIYSFCSLPFLIEIKKSSAAGPFIQTRCWRLPGVRLPRCQSGRASWGWFLLFQQLQNQELLRAMMKKAELEISGKVVETMKRLEDPVQRQRVLVEQERQKYLREEEKIVKKLWWVPVTCGILAVSPEKVACLCQLGGPSSVMAPHPLLSTHYVQVHVLLVLGIRIHLAPFHPGPKNSAILRCTMFFCRAQ